jgi:RNA polymerase sigma-70 factor, ECF subfamily
MDFQELYGRHARDVFRFALFLSGNHAVAEDVAAETFARVFVCRDELRAATVKAYLFTIARNLYLDARRRERRLVPLPQDLPDRPDLSPAADQTADDRARLGAVLAALRQLPEPQREALVMAVDQGLSHAEIAVVLGCSVSAVKVRIHRARARLKEVLAGKEALS